MLVHWLWFLPPLSPDLNPRGRAFQQFLKISVKQFNSISNTDNPRVLVSAAFATVTQSDCLGYFDMQVTVNSTHACFFFYANKTLYQDVVMQFMIQIKLHMQSGKNTGQTNS